MLWNKIKKWVSILWVVNNTYLGFIDQLKAVALPEGVTQLMGSMNQTHAQVTGVMVGVLGLLLIYFNAIRVEQSIQLSNIYQNLVYGQFLYWAVVTTKEIRFIQKLQNYRFIRATIKNIPGYTNPYKSYDNAILERILLSGAFCILLLLLLTTTSLVYTVAEIHDESASNQISAKQWFWGNNVIYPVMANQLGYQQINRLSSCLLANSSIAYLSDTTSNVAIGPKGGLSCFAYLSERFFDLGLIDQWFLLVGGYFSTWLSTSYLQIEATVEVNPFTHNEYTLGVGPNPTTQKTLSDLLLELNGIDYPDYKLINLNNILPYLTYINSLISNFITAEKLLILTRDSNNFKPQVVPFRALGDELIISKSLDHGILSTQVTKQENLKLHNALERFGLTNIVTPLPFVLWTSIIVASTDVIHSFWLWDFGIKLDCFPSSSQQTDTFSKIHGLSTNSCAEFCGVGHANMPVTIKIYDSNTCI